MFIDTLSWLSLISGSAFLIISGVGLIRLPDFFTRLHAAGIADTLGAALVILGLSLQAGWSLVLLKLVFILFFILLTSPTACHALGKAALHERLVPQQQTEEDSPSKPS